MAIDVCFFHFAICIITNQQFPVVKCHSHLFKEWSRCGHQRLVWLRSCWVGIECLLKTKNRDQMAGWVARLLIMSFQEQCNHSVQFITYWKCKRCIFNRIEHVLPDCDCTFMTYTSPYKSGHSRCRGLLLRPFVLESSVAMTTISLLSCSHGHKGSLMIPKGWLGIRPAQRYPAQNIYLCSWKTTRLEQDVATNITQYWAIMWLHIH